LGVWRGGFTVSGGETDADGCAIGTGRTAAVAVAVARASVRRAVSFMVMVGGRWLMDGGWRGWTRTFGDWVGHPFVLLVGASGGFLEL